MSSLLWNCIYMTVVQPVMIVKNLFLFPLAHSPEHNTLDQWHHLSLKIISSNSEALLVIDLKCFLPFIVTSALWWDSLVPTHGVLAGDPAVVWPTLASRSHHHHHHHQWWWHLPRPPLHPRKIDTVKTKTNYFYEKNFLQVFSASTRAGCTYWRQVSKMQLSGTYLILLIDWCRVHQIRFQMRSIFNVIIWV